MKTYDTSIWKNALARQKEKREVLRTTVLSNTIHTLQSYFSGKRVLAVYLCGSILRPGAFDEDSDIDIAVAGLQENTLRVSADLEELLNRDIDLIELEHCRFREAIEKEGMKIV